MMRLSTILLAMADRSKKGLGGRTRIQKGIYFLRRPLQVAVSYQPHFFGPYSEEVAATLRSMVAEGLLEETDGSAPDRPFEQRGYRYTLTDDGRKLLEFWRTECPEEEKHLEHLIQTLALDDDETTTRVLAVASKIHFIVAGSKQAVPKGELVDRAFKFGWRLKLGECEEAVEFLCSHKLLRVS